MPEVGRYLRFFCVRHYWFTRLFAANLLCSWLGNLRSTHRGTGIGITLHAAEPRLENVLPAGKTKYCPYPDGSTAPPTVEVVENVTYVLRCAYTGMYSIFRLNCLCKISRLMHMPPQ